MINQIGALSAITVAIILTSTAAAEEIRHDLAADVDGLVQFVETEATVVVVQLEG